INTRVSKKLSKSKHTITSFDMIDDHTADFIDAHNRSTGYLVVQIVDDTEKCQQLTNWNEKLFNSLNLSDTEHIKFTSVDNIEIEGWLMKPSQQQNNKKIPLVLQIHGGATCFIWLWLLSRMAINGCVWICCIIFQP